MKWSLMQLQKLRNLGQLKVDETIELPELVALHPDIRAVQPVHVRANASFTSNQLIFNLRITGEMTLPDSRTLRDVAYPFEIESIEPFLLEAGASPIDSEEMNVPDGNTVDLRPLVQELILLHVPVQVHGDEAGDQLVQGEGWNVISEGEPAKDEEPKIDPRLAGLAQFFKKDQDS
ncbi:YceD family protein [Exiguobacterium flavidum]|uniref:YceD family protein n=1 Tax=Exiguobacterium flavidum TaxID=2184695 RepID=UPI000DF776FD|nr:YceD family protein [Exiguobacterium flavidum]